MDYFYSNNVCDDIIRLDSIESKHCMVVLRKKIGDKIKIVDGIGNLFIGEIISYTSKECQVKVKEVIQNYDKKEYYIHIAISPLKNHNRIEWFIEKSVEIGIDEISFIDCFRTVRKRINISRLNKRAISAMKQTLKASIPKINPPIMIADFMYKNKDKNKFICHLEENISQTIFDYKNDFKINNSSCIMIGPEGDFTIDEIKKSKQCNFNFLSLGDSRLRTETAGIVACHLLNILNNTYD